MNKKLTRTIAGVMSLMFVGQIMVFGDGASQGILHADTIASAAEAIEGAKNKDQLAKDFEEATKGLGEVDYFELPESVEQNNAHKLDEIRAILGDRVEVLSLKDIHCEAYTSVTPAYR